MMKEGACIINTSRGSVIDEKALIESLKRGKVGGAGRDVGEEEPKVSKELLEMKNVTITPHIGTASKETRTKMEQLSLDNAIAVLEGKKPLTPVNDPKE